MYQIFMMIKNFRESEYSKGFGTIEENFIAYMKISYTKEEIVAIRFEMDKLTDLFQYMI